MLTRSQKINKRVVDIILSSIGVIFCIIPIFVLVLVSTILHLEFGLFFQKRVGLNGELFTIVKIKSMRLADNTSINSFGKFLRKFKLDELPQLFNVFLGQMSIVGPRPDVIGYADMLEGEDRIILTVKPGLTSPATIRFSNEEVILSQQEEPKLYNDEVLWPQKVKMNKAYVENYSLIEDFKIMFKTFFLPFS